MNIELKNSAKPVDYIESVRILEERVKDVLQGKKREFVWILEHKTVFTAGTSFLEEELIDKNINIIYCS